MRKINVGLEKLQKKMIDCVEGFGLVSKDSDSESDKENNYLASNAVLCIRSASRVQMYTGCKRDAVVLEDDERPRSCMQFAEGYGKNPPATYKMDHDITTVTVLWKEWYVVLKTFPL